MKKIKEERLANGVFTIAEKLEMMKKIPLTDETKKACCNLWIAMLWAITQE